MPLGPKQQPPYYIPEPIPTPGANSTVQKVATQIITIQTTDTSNLTAAPYTMPANTMTTNGDVLTMDYFGNTYTTDTQKTVSLSIFGQNYTFPILGQVAWRITAQIIRSTSNIAYYAATFFHEAQTQEQSIQGSIGSIDWTIPIDIQLTIRAPTDGNIRCTAGHTTIIKTL